MNPCVMINSGGGKKKTNNTRFKDLGIPFGYYVKTTTQTCNKIGENPVECIGHTELKENVLSTDVLNKLVSKITKNN